jgi:hypothetical protein
MMENIRSFPAGTRDSLQRRLGERWNGPFLPDRLLGFPIDVTRCAAWYPVPEFFEIPQLHALLDEVLKNPGRQVIGKPPDAIVALIVKELNNEHRQKTET